jgi:hypothetical protein
MFLDLVADDDEVALLLIIHWSVLIYQSPKASVSLWAKRTAKYAIKLLKARERWRNLLARPIQALQLCESEHLALPTVNDGLKFISMNKQRDDLYIHDCTILRCYADVCAAGQNLGVVLSSHVLQARQSCSLRLSTSDVTVASETSDSTAALCYGLPG